MTHGRSNIYPERLKRCWFWTDENCSLWDKIWPSRNHKKVLYEPLCKVSSNFYHFKCWRPWDSKRDVLAWFCINCLGKLISFESLLSDIWPSRRHKKGPHIILGIKFLITLIMLCVKGSKSWLYNNNSVIFVSI